MTVILKHIFQDNNGTIENEELRGFLKDLLELVKKVRFINIKFIFFIEVLIYLFIIRNYCVEYIYYLMYIHHQLFN